MPDYKQLSLRQSAEFDHRTGQKNKLTGWGKICRDRAAKKISRKARREQRGAERDINILKSLIHSIGGEV